MGSRRRPSPRSPAAVRPQRGVLRAHDDCAHGLHDNPLGRPGPAAELGLHPAGPHRQTRPLCGLPPGTKTGL